MARLSLRQRQTLEFMLKFRDDNPSAADVVVANRWRYLLLFGYFALVGTGVGVGMYYGLTFLLPFGCVFGGMLFGNLVQQFAMLRANAEVWPVTREVIDFGKVQRLIDEDDWAQGGPHPDELRDQEPAA